MLNKAFRLLHNAEYTLHTIIIVEKLHGHHDLIWEEFEGLCED